METLADLALREVLRPHTRLQYLTTRPMVEFKNALLRAHRFVLDRSMSEFLGDLSVIPFIATKDRQPEVLNSLRHGAMLPHPVTWIEIDGRAFRKRLIEVNELETTKNAFRAVGMDKDEIAHDVYGNPIAGPDQVPQRWGWLLEQHPTMPTAIKITEFLDLDDTVATVPFHWVYQTTDDPLPWHADTRCSVFAHGIVPYICPQIGVVMDQPPQRHRHRDWVTVHDGEGKTFKVHHMVVEMGGVARYIIAFLATLNDIPVLQHEVRPQKGFIARGKYRKFLEHKVLTLNVPQRTDTTRLAKKLVVAARRRAHEVRGHWRILSHLPVTKRCGQNITNLGDLNLNIGSYHTWGPMDETHHSKCVNCDMRRVWINKYQRGDASLGWVRHDYVVKHEVDNAKT